MNVSKTLLVLGASAVLVTADDPVEPTYQLNVAITGYKNKSKFLNQAWETAQEEAPELDDAPLKAFEAECATGSSTLMELGPDGPDFAKVLSKKDLERWESGEIDEKFFKKVINKVDSKYGWDTKLYWVSTPEQAAKPACTKDKVFEVMLTQINPKLKSNVKMNKMVAPVVLTKDQFDACVTRTTADAINEPVCTTVDPEDEAQKAIVKACTACSINNSIVASAFGAAAMVALAVFF